MGQQQLKDTFPVLHSIASRSRSSIPWSRHISLQIPVWCNNRPHRRLEAFRCQANNQDASPRQLMAFQVRSACELSLQKLWQNDAKVARSCICGKSTNNFICSIPWRNTGSKHNIFFFTVKRPTCVLLLLRTLTYSTGNYLTESISALTCDRV